jgi:sugar phosphate isomerase/epimerase
MNRRNFLALSAPLLARAAKLSEFRLGVTSDEIDEDLAVAVKFLREFNLSWTEIRNLWGKYNTDQPVEKIREARKIMDEHGVKLSALATPFFRGPVPVDDAALDHEWKLLETAFTNAGILGSKTIRTFAFTYPANQKPDASLYPQIYELQREAARRATARGFRLAIETLDNSYVWSSTQAAALLKAVPQDSLGLTWDPNNVAGIEERPFPDGYKRLDPARIFHVHLRDWKRGSDGKVAWTAVGQGEFDNLGQLRALKRDGFNGTFTLETHWRSPHGKAYATRVSLTELIKVFEQV